MVEDIDIGGEHEARSDQAVVTSRLARMMVQRFRETFPRTRWSEKCRAWIVPGKTARRRIDPWLGGEDSRVDPYLKEKGRDAYAFEPILSACLLVDKEKFRIQTPYSRVPVKKIREVPFARWSGEQRVGRMPFASYDDLLERWQTIEEEARRSTPDERRKRAEAREDADDERMARRRAAERKRRRIPLLAAGLPPTERLMATQAHGLPS